MLRFFARKPCLGVEITTSAVQLAAVTGSRPNISVEYAKTADLPSGMMTCSYASPNIGDVTSLVQVLRECLSGSPGDYRRAALSLPDSVFRVQTLEFDELPPKPTDRERLIRWRLEKTAAFDLAETVLRYQILRRQENGFTVLACVAKHAVIAQYESVLIELGLEPWSVGVSSFHILNLYSPIISKRSPIFALARLTEDSFATVVAEAGGTRFYRYKEVKRGSAEEIKARFVQEIADSLHFYMHMDRTQTSQVRHLYLTGDSNMPYDLADELGIATSLSVEVLCPADAVTKDDLSRSPSAWLVAMAAALGAGSSL